MRRVEATVMVLLAVLLGMSALASASDTSVLVFLTPKWAMGSEYELLVEALAEYGLEATPVAESAGAYTFWEDSPEGQSAGAPAGRYTLDVSLTYDDIVLSAHRAVILGPGFGHTMWIGPTREQAKAFVHEALELRIPVGGISLGAVMLVEWGIMNGRSAAMPPYIQGVLTPGTNRAHYLNDYPEVEFEDACVWVDRTGGQTVIVTGTYFCLQRFVADFVDVL